MQPPPANDPASPPSRRTDNMSELAERRRIVVEAERFMEEYARDLRAGDRPVTHLYSALLVRENGAFRIRQEHEAPAPR